MKYLIQPEWTGKATGPTWRKLLIPAIGVGAAWMFAWKWYKSDPDNWNNLKKKMTKSAAKTWEVEHNIKPNPVETKPITNSIQSEAWKRQ